MRADLLRDYEPTTTQERLLIEEVAATHRRLVETRRREHLFFDMQKHNEAVKAGVAPEEFSRDGAEVVMWLEKPHRAYDQITIRDAGMAFDRAIRRVEQVIGARKRRERQAEKDQAARVESAAKLVILQTRAAAAVAKASAPPPDRRPSPAPRINQPNPARAPDAA